MEDVIGCQLSVANGPNTSVSHGGRSGNDRISGPMVSLSTVQC
jgi:hypothetical protein